MGNANEQDLAMLHELEQRLNAEMKGVQEGNQTATVKTLDLQSSQDDIVQMQIAASTVASEVEALNLELSAPPRSPEDRGRRRPAHSRREETEIDDRADHFGSFFGGLFGSLSSNCSAKRSIPPRKSRPTWGFVSSAPCRSCAPKPNAANAVTRRSEENDRYWRNLMLESIDATRTMLVHAARTGSHRMVMVTSAVGGEGKTSLASHLATSLAGSGQRTLLIDADLRSPSIHRLLDLPTGPGVQRTNPGRCRVVCIDRGYGHRRVESHHGGELRSADHPHPRPRSLGSDLCHAQGAIRFRDRRLLTHPPGG